MSRENLVGVVKCYNSLVASLGTKFSPSSVQGVVQSTRCEDNGPGAG